jgi:hypothetical protein
MDVQVVVVIHLAVVCSAVAKTVVAAIAGAEVASVVDIGVEVVRLVATAEMTPRKYFVVAIVAVDIPGLVVVALFIPLST